MKFTKLHKSLSGQNFLPYTLPVLLSVTILVLVYSINLAMVDFSRELSTSLYDRNGVLLGAKVSASGQWKFASTKNIDQKFFTALINFEDRRFYYHPGVDALALVRASLANLRAGRITSGASTISMQVARLSLPASDRNYLRKIREIVLALCLEARYGKWGMLQNYANIAPLGGNVIGVEAASMRYFGHSASRLSWAEASMLAVLPNAPALTHLGKNRDQLLTKRNKLLTSMYQRGLLSLREWQLSIAENLPPQAYPLPQLAPHLLETIASAPNFSAKSIKTSLDASLQIKVQEILANHSAEFVSMKVYNAAILVADIDSGEVRAYIGNSTNDTLDDHGQAVDIIQSRRSSGSLLKPFLYASMLEHGELTPQMLVPDIPTHIGSYNPENNLETYTGAVAAQVALARSLNIPFVRLLQSYGVERFQTLLKNIGFTSFTRSSEEYGLPLILGGGEVSPWEIAGRYAALMRTAKNLQHSGREQFFDLSYLPARPRRYYPDYLSPASAYLTIDALTNVERPGEEAHWQNYAHGAKIAWKTGTSFGLRDAWAIGMNSKYIVAVWVGNASGEGRPELRGTQIAAPVLFEVFNILPAAAWINPPKDFHTVKLCADSGYLATPSCPRFVEIQLPLSAPLPLPSPYCVQVRVSEDEQYQVRAGETTNSKLLPWFVLPPSMEWYYKQNHLEYKTLPPFKNSTDSNYFNGKEFAVLSPIEGAQLYVPIELSGQEGKTIFTAHHRDSSAHLYWYIDTNFIAITGGDRAQEGEHQIAVSPKSGPHILTVTDDTGTSITRNFTILNERK